MKNNVVFLCIDALSYWYIEEYKKAYKGSFFNALDNMTYHATEMYSVGPFTEAGLQGLFASQHPLDNENYLTYFTGSNRMLFDVLQENEYQVYIGGAVTMLGDFPADVWGYKTLSDFNYEGQAAYDFWQFRMNHFFELYNRGALKKEERGLFADVICFLFEWFHDEDDPAKQREYSQYIQDPEQYVDELLSLQKEHGFYKYFLNTGLLEAECTTRERMVNSVLERLPEPDEARIFTEIDYKNKKRFFNINRKFCESDSKYKNEVEDMIAGDIGNRCVQTGNLLLSHVRDCFREQAIPTMGREIDHFLSWLDSREENDAYISYLHVFDFHYWENIMENDRGNYRGKLKELEAALKDMPDMNMSVPRTLALIHIERQLKRLWEELEKRGFFRDSYLIITADHGFSNFMYPVPALDDDEFVYHKMHFNVPFYMAGNGMKPKENAELLENLDIPVSMLYMLGIPIPKEYKGKNFFGEGKCHDYLYTEWINGCPNVIRSQIKFGFRDKKYSATYVASLNEFMDMGKCIAAYDLENDPDEALNLVSHKNIDEMLKTSLAVVCERWYELLCHYYLDFDGKYFGENRIWRLLKENPEKMKNWLEEQRQFSYETFCRDVEGKKIILFGASEFAKDFMEKAGLRIYEIWDNSGKKNNTSFMGHLVRNPYEISENKDDYAFILANRYEVETRIQLDDMGFKRVYLGKLVLHAAAHQ